MIEYSVNGKTVLSRTGRMQETTTAKEYIMEYVPGEQLTFDDYVPVHDPSAFLVRSNNLIMGRYRATLMESKLLAMTLYECQPKAKGMQAKDVVRFTTAQLIQGLGMRKNSSIYSQLRNAAVGVADNKIIIETTDERFAVINLIEYAKFEGGVLELKITKTARDNISFLTSNYTPMLLPILLSFGNGDSKAAARSNYTFRLYELLRTQLYRCTDSRPVYRFSMGLSDIRISIGCIDISDPGVRKAIMSSKGNSDMIVEKFADKKDSAAFARYTDFDNRILKKAQEEINEKTDLFFTYHSVKSGRGGRVHSIVFEIRKNPKKPDFIKEEIDITRLIEEMEEIIEEPITFSGMKKILSAAGNDLERVRKAYALAKPQMENIRNLTAWLVKAIQEEWEEEEKSHTVPREKGIIYQLGQTTIELSAGTDTGKRAARNRSPKKNEFNNFPQHEYDFDELERELVNS